MGTYDEARIRTQTAIEEAFWILYTGSSSDRITVRMVTERAGVHRATFYMYYQNTESVLQSIKDRQLDMLRELCALPRDTADAHASFLEQLQQLFIRNRHYLVPLLCEYRDHRFAEEYREIMKEALREDLRLPVQESDTRYSLILDMILLSFIETMIQGLTRRVMPSKEVWKLTQLCMSGGVRPALESLFGAEASQGA